MKQSLSIQIIISLCIFLVSCTGNIGDAEQYKQEIISADKSMSVLAAEEGFNKALLEYASDDFVKFSEGEYPVIGKPEFAKHIEGKPDTKSITWEPVKADVAASGELGYTWGEWKMVRPDTTLYGNYFSVWKKDKTGKWKLALDGGNSSPKPQRN